MVELKSLKAIDKELVNLIYKPLNITKSSKVTDFIKNIFKRYRPADLIFNDGSKTGTRQNHWMLREYYGRTD